ncbi:Zinc-type alcohol dehydrogenase-like protein [Paraburkholderia hiiakae]|uniref:Zinc-type alcohol dehydrogenase-like protein n=1 Tax=Paraburkholderia hiiakae TaxID=1081782 RepID=A0ABM8NZJ9_9BURK|nr:NADP-dependent oxidoreductase [Paraburkholderia hiiakae]CAD6550754.1 Zinc-type alcohol dehydrogenase-like protein [Paraburkholderia hiiakae]
MRAAFITGYGDNTVLRSGELPDPTPGADEALIEVRAAGINPVEIAMRQGLFHAAFPFSFPQVMGYDIAGIVLSAPASSAFRSGDAVWARLPNSRPGAYAELAVVPVDLLARKPQSLSFEEAASLPTVALTTWQAFTERAHVSPGERVLIQAGAGGVGLFAIQLAKHMGCHVAATGGPSTQEFMAQFGADRTIDYTREAFEDAGPFDVVYDGVCGPLIERGIDSLRDDGRYVGLVRVADSQAYCEIGFPPPVAAKAAAGVLPFIERARARNAEFHGPLTRPDGADLEEIARIVDSGAIRATVSQTYSLDQLASAYDALAGGHTRGKLVILP